MFCEGDKTYPENVGCPVCGMDLVKITGNDDESEDDTYKNLKKKFWISAAFTLPILDMIDDGSRKIQLLVLCPTRELCLQITKDIKNYSK